jgi:hypothetical protein
LFDELETSATTGVAVESARNDVAANGHKALPVRAKEQCGRRTERHRSLSSIALAPQSCSAESLLALALQPRQTVEAPSLRSDGILRNVLVLAALVDQLVTLVIGFGLTTIVGGLLGAYFQRRNWDYQNERTLAEADRTHATNTCRELSHLMDKRLYRMLQVRWALFADDLDQERIEEKMAEYRSVLSEWNDNLMRNLAAAEIGFGSTVRGRLETQIYERFKLTGVMLEARYAQVAPRATRRTQPAASRVDEIDEALALIRAHIYKLNLEMLAQIRDGRVGRSAPGDALRND